MWKSIKTLKEVGLIFLVLAVLFTGFGLLVRAQVSNKHKEDLSNAWFMDGDSIFLIVNEDIPADTTSVDRYIILRFKDRDVKYRKQTN